MKKVGSVRKMLPSCLSMYVHESAVLACNMNLTICGHRNKDRKRRLDFFSIFKVDGYIGDADCMIIC